MSTDLLPDGLPRCPWPKQDRFMSLSRPNGECRARRPRAVRRLCSTASRPASPWITILRKRDNFRRAFDGFAPEKIAVTRPEGRAPDAGCRHRADRLKIEGAVLGPRLSGRHGEGRRLRAPAVAIPRRQPAGEPAAPSRSRPRPRCHPSRSTRLCAAAFLLRPDHRLCVHAGDRHGQRPFDDVPPARGLRQAECQAHQDRRQDRRQAVDAHGGRPHLRGPGAPGSACCRDAGSITLEIPPARHRDGRYRHGLARVARCPARPKARTSSRSRSIVCWWRRSRGGARASTGGGGLAALPEYVIGDDLAVQGGDRRHL